VLRIGEAQTVRQRYTPAQALLIRALARDVDIEVPDRITPYTAALYGSFTGIFQYRGRAVALRAQA
jgi:hypothetical protein